MNGLLTALLGGAAGTGQGLQYQDEKAMKLQAQKMERLSMATEMIKNGITPPKDLLAGFDLGTDVPQAPQVSAPSVDAPQIPTPSGPGANVPQGTLTSLMTPRTRTRDGFTGGAPVTQPTQAGGVSATDAIKNAAAGSPPQFGASAPVTMGGLQVDMTRSQPYRVAMIGLQKDQTLEAYKTQLAEEKIQRDAQVILGAGQRNPSTGQPFTPQEAMNIARNHSLALDSAPVLGTPQHLAATGAVGRQTANIDLDKAIRMAPITAATAAQTVAATTPGEVAKAGQVAGATSAVNPPEAQLRAAGALQTATHAKKAIDAFVQRYGSPGMMTQLAQKYPSIGNYLDSKEGQVLRNAAINFLDASMDASGQQRYNGSVLEQKIHALIPWSGDNPETLQSKLGFIEDAMHSMRVNSGAALPRGDTVAPGAAPSHMPQSPTPKAAAGGRTVTVNGKTFKLPD